MANHEDTEAKAADAATSASGGVKAAAERLVAAGHKAFGIRCDVSDDAQVEAMVERTVAEFGRLDAAFNNAGVDSVTVGFKNTAEIDEAIENLNLALNV